LQLADGSVQVPSLVTSANKAAWYKYSAVPGQVGASVIEGHVDSNHGPAVFFRLGALNPGDLIDVQLADGVTAVFKVTGVRRYAKSEFPAKEIYGPPDYAAQLTVPDALAFQEAIGSARRAARLRALRDRWVHAVRDLPQVQVLTPEDPSLYGAITSFRLRGRTTKDDNVALAKTLLDKHRIFTVYRDGLASGCCVRVTPALATRMSDVDALAAAIREIATA